MNATSYIGKEQVHWRLLLIVALSAAAVCAQNKGELGFACFARFSAPQYPALIRLAGLTGVVEAAVNLDENSKVKKITLAGSARELLRRQARFMLEGARYRSDCAAGKVTIKIKFELSGTAATQSESRVTLVWPDQIIIQDRPPLVQQ